MRFLNVILILLLLAAVAGGAYFYQFYFRDMSVQAQLSKTNAAQLDLTKKQLKKFQDQEAREAGWIPAAAETLRTGLKEEIAAGKAEVVVAGSRLVVNLPEDVLYQQGSKTFSRTSPATLTKIASVLKTLKGLNDKQILIGNTTASVAARGKGRRRVPAKDGRVLAAERSLELVKYLEKNGVSGDQLASVAYSPKSADQGFKIKEKKTIIVISMPPSASIAAPLPAAVPAQMPALAPQAKPAAPAAQLPARPAQPVAPQAVQPKPVPIPPR